MDDEPKTAVNKKRKSHSDHTEVVAKNPKAKKSQPTTTAKRSPLVVSETVKMKEKVRKESKVYKSAVSTIDTLEIPGL